MATTGFRSAASASSTIISPSTTPPASAIDATHTTHPATNAPTATTSEDLSTARLLVNLDTSNRTEAELISNTIRELLQVASGENIHSLRDAVKNAILIAFKRRNHKKSLADGEGPGEKRIFLEILVAIIELKEYDDLILAILPLIPVYGSWRDLAVLAEVLLMNSMITAEGDVPLSPIVEAICDLFAKQMVKDSQQLESEPSNACKYCPHEGRHRVKKRKTEAMETVEGSDSRRWTREERSADGKEDVAKRRRANALLSSTIARLACPLEQGRARASFRRLRACLNSRLQKNGHLVEPLLCNGNLGSIDFARANKGSLQKYSKAIKRNVSAVAKWKVAMKENAKAVPDMDDLLTAVKLFLEEEASAETTDHETRVDIFPSQLNKAIKTLSGAQATLLCRAKQLLETAGGRSAEEIDELVAAMPKVMIVVDTADCKERPQRLSLLLAGLLLCRALGHQSIVVDGNVVDLRTVTEESWGILCPSIPSSTTGAISRLDNSLNAVREQVKEDGGQEFDILLLCRYFAAGEEDNDAVLELLRRFQAPSNYDGPRLRTLRLHRIRHRLSSVGTEGIIYLPRPRAEPLAPSLASADLLFVVDFTGSMGPYMDAVKTELVSLIQELQSYTRLRNVRVGLVGYRDFDDVDRVVSVSFRDQEDVGSIIDTIRHQNPSGGGDMPEDMLSAFVAAHALSWRSDVRVMVVITDADAHGCNTYVHDNYPSGRCPDQREPDYPSLSEVLQRLAVEDHVDCLFCQLNDNTGRTERALYKVYEDHLGGKGFGTVSLQQQGVESFRAKVLASVTTVLLGSLAEKDIAGLQTADGCTVSSLAATLQASVRESLCALGVGDREETTAAQPQSDWQRLQRELEIEALQPVRMALGLPLPSHLDSLSQRAAAALFKAGLTVEMLEKNGYPEPVVAAFRAHLQALLPAI